MVENQSSKSDNSVFCASTKTSKGIQSNPVIDVQLKNVISIEKIAEAITPKAIDLTTRTSQRIFNEKQIIQDLSRLLQKFNSEFKVMPFGSATYGFGGIDTNFNICLINGGKNNFHIYCSNC